MGDSDLGPMGLDGLSWKPEDAEGCFGKVFTKAKGVAAALKELDRAAKGGKQGTV
jgi:hypothetical protein